MSFLFRRNDPKNKRGEVDFDKEPFSLHPKHVKRLNKKHGLQTHFVGVINLASNEPHFCQQVLEAIEKNFKNLKCDNSKSRASKNEIKADQELLILADDEDSDDDDDEGLESMDSFWDPELSNGVCKQGVLGFNFGQMALRCAVSVKAQDCFTADLELTKKILKQGHWFRELDEEGTYMFKALLPSKNQDNSFRIQHWLSGLLVITDSQNSDSEHLNCTELARKLAELEPILRQAYRTNNAMKRTPSEIQNNRLIIMNSSGVCPKMNPSNVNLENVASPCLTCLEIKTNFDCKFAPDLTSAVSFLVEQDIYRYFPELIRMVNMELSGLY